MLVAFVTLISTVVTWSLLRAVIPQLRRIFPDHPNSRSSHYQPIPRGGGIVFVSLTLASALMQLLTGHVLTAAALPLFVAPLAVVGLIDDRLNLPAWCRFAVQVVTAFLILGLSPLVHPPGFNLASGNFLLLTLYFFLVIAVTAVINFTNFMDGLDGLVAGCMAVTVAALAISLNLALPLWVLVGSLFGFLLLNWSPAKVFMGDVGSTFLGAMFAGLVLQANNWSEAFGCLLVATPLLGDSCICVLRRLLAGQPVFQAHRLHLFQRLQQAGWPHARVSLTYITGTAFLALAMFIGGLLWVLSFAVAEMLLGFWLDQRVAVPFSVASKS